MGDLIELTAKIKQIDSQLYQQQMKEQAEKEAILELKRKQAGEPKDPLEPKSRKSRGRNSVLVQKTPQTQNKL